MIYGMSASPGGFAFSTTHAIGHVSFNQSFTLASSRAAV
jgi:hypothetical protein